MIVGISFRFFALLALISALAGCASSSSNEHLPKGEDRQPVAVLQPIPVYPVELMKAGITGIVWVEFIIGSDGSVKAAQVIRSSHPGFNQPALAAIYESRFRPGLKNGRPVNARVQQSLKFELNDEISPPSPVKTAP